MALGGRGEDEGGEASMGRVATRELEKGGRGVVLREIRAIPGSERLQSSRRSGGQRVDRLQRPVDKWKRMKEEPTWDGVLDARDSFRCRWLGARLLYASVSAVSRGKGKNRGPVLP
jgi:hypothetical protein